MKTKKGLFISFEGPEASWKSSQILLLKKYFQKNKIPFIITREPGGTLFSEKLRNIILNNKSNISNFEEGNCHFPLLKNKKKHWRDQLSLSSF